MTDESTERGAGRVGDQPGGKHPGQRDRQAAEDVCGRGSTAKSWSQAQKATALIWNNWFRE